MYNICKLMTRTAETSNSRGGVHTRIAKRVQPERLQLVKKSYEPWNLRRGSETSGGGGSASESLPIQGSSEQLHGRPPATCRRAQSDGEAVACTNRSILEIKWYINLTGLNHTPDPRPPLSSSWRAAAADSLADASCPGPSRNQATACQWVTGWLQR